MNFPRLLASLAVLSVAAAQAESPTPYAGQESRDIKALAPAEVADLLAGKGMGYAKAAELNGYPGPAHVLELADQLGLSAQQRARSREIFAGMQASAKELGAQLIEAERALDALFRDRQASTPALSPALERVAALQARLRGAHLQAHIEQTRLLSAEQVARYAVLRGYAGTAEAQPQHQRHHHP